MGKKQQVGLTKAENFVKRFLEDKQGTKAELHTSVLAAIYEKLNIKPGKHTPPEYMAALTRFIYN
jgi:hypothetical protein